MFAFFNKMVVLQTPVDHVDQLLCVLVHINIIGPHAPPECKLTIDSSGGSIGQNGCAWSIFGDQTGRIACTGEDYYCNDARFFGECTSGMAHGMLLGELL